MCGIAGIYAHAPSASNVDEAELLRIRERMTSRGPDGAGLWVDKDRRIGLAHRRLAVIELRPCGAQPMVREGGDLVVTFNGEIYNYDALRAQLIDAGYTFQTRSDTEVLLHLYAQKGPAMLADLRGMFAFAIWDARKDELFLARDTYGIKPLYYANDAGTIRFASSVKALHAGGAISREPDLAGQAGFYLTGSVPEPFTTYRAISSLPAGSWMKVGAGGAQAPVIFQTIAQIYEDAERRAPKIPNTELEEYTRAAFLDSVRHHMAADVAVGAFLSAGVDSGALVGLMRDAGAQRLETLTLRFEEFKGGRDDEAPLAAELAELYQTQHSNRVVTAQEFRDDLPKILEAMDQPTIDGVNSWFVSKAASERGMKVAISGLGGDELLGGYPSFTDVPRWKRMFAGPSSLPGLGTGLRQIGRAALGHTNLPPKAFSMVEYGGRWEGAYFLKRGLFMPWELGRIMGREAAEVGLRQLDLISHIRSRLRRSDLSDNAQVSTLESSLYMRNQLLRDVDWASMAHSLEVRVPLVDVPLLTSIAPIVARLSKNAGKSLLANAPTKPVPSSIAHRPKTGFGIPIGPWSGLGRHNKDQAYGHSRAWAQSIAGETWASAGS